MLEILSKLQNIFKSWLLRTLFWLLLFKYIIISNFFPSHYLKSLNVLYNLYKTGTLSIFKKSLNCYNALNFVHTYIIHHSSITMPQNSHWNIKCSVHKEQLYTLQAYNVHVVFNTKLIYDYRSLLFNIELSLIPSSWDEDEKT